MEESIKELLLIEGFNPLKITQSEGSLSIIVKNPKSEFKDLEAIILKRFPDVKSVRILSYQDIKANISGVKKLIVVASGKGGVGKSTFAVALAYKLKSLCLKVGILDADFYGPSLPIFFKDHYTPDSSDGKLTPVKLRGFDLMSIGFLINDLDAPAWRGPMVSKILHQMLLSTAWSNLDYLIIDMPPGTGDIHISLLEKYEINHVIFVTIPSDLAKADLQRAVEMYKKFSSNIDGVVENMFFNKSLEYNIPIIDHISFDINHKVETLLDDKKNILKIILEK